MIGTIGDFKANYKAIIHSENLAASKKMILLRNLLNDVELVFFGSYESDPYISEYQEEAKQLCNDIRYRFASY